MDEGLGIPINNTSSSKRCPDYFEYFEGTGFCYGYNGGAAGTLWQAEEWCSEKGGHVPSIHSNVEFQYLRSNILFIIKK